MAQILLLEDEPLVRRSLSLFLKMGAHSVVCAPNGRGAGDLAATHRAELVITDLVMPEVEGLQAIRELRASGFAGPIIAMTGGRPIRTRLGDEAGADYLASAMALGATAALAKPFSARDLLSLVTRCLAPPSGERAGRRSCGLQP